MQNRNILYGVIVVIVLVALASYWLDHRNPSSTANSFNTSTSTDTSASPTDISIATSSEGAVVAAGGNGAYTINVVPDKAPAKAPDYTKPIAFSSSISPSVKTAIQAQFNLTVAALAKDQNDFNAWIDLGSQHHMGGDDQAAATIWEYASVAWPSNVVSHNNLGDLYANFLKDYAKAESNYLAAIKNKPDDSNPYKNLFTLYYNAGYNTNKAEGILKQGIAAVPKAVDLQVLLARYYRDSGRTADAKAEYDLAIKNAQSQNQTDLATSLQSESSAF